MAEASKKRQRVRSGPAGPSSELAIPSVEHNGRKCLLRLPDAQVWSSGTIVSSRKGTAGSVPEVQVQMEDESGKPKKFSLTTQTVYIASRVAWGRMSEERDEIGPAMHQGRT